ncbi:MAG: hypothetical protein JWR62_2469, partial [Modestobacter sp.]|nr:hypothetical protein [Modestobacter sp.]
MDALARWADELAAWAIDPALLAAAPESAYGFPAGLSARTVEPPSRTRPRAPRRRAAC